MLRKKFAQLLHSTRTMADAVLDVIAQQRERVVVTFGTEDGVVAESAFSLALFQDGSLYHSLEKELLALYY